MKLIGILILLFSCSAAYAQSDSFTYGGSDDDIGYSFTGNGHGGYVLLAAERTAVDSSEQISIINIDQYGNKIWKRIYGDIHQDIPEHIERTSDGGYIIAGSKWDWGYTGLDAYIMKLDEHGNMLWDKYVSGNAREELFSIKETTDGGYIMSGFSNSDTLLSFGQMYIVKTNASGDEEWSAFAGGPGKDYAFDVFETSDGNFVATGHYAGFHRYSTFEFTETHSDILVTKLDDAGTILWSNTYGGMENELGYQSVEGPDGSIFVIGSTQSSGNGSFDINLLKIDPNGNELWSKTYGGAGFDYGKSLELTEDGHLYITGTTNADTLTHKTDIIVIKAQLDGTPVWTTTFGGVGSDYGNQIHQTKDGGCAVIGYSNSESGTNDDVYFLKLDANGIIQPLNGSDITAVTVFPNPASESVNFYIEEGSECFDYHYEITDINGKVVFERDKNSKIVSIDLTHFGAGMYYYRISSPCMSELGGKFIVH